MTANKAKLLFIKAEKDTLAVTDDFLGAKGYEIIQSDDGYISLDLARRERPDIILIDMDFLGLQGNEISRGLRKISHAPILLLSKKSDLADKIKGFELGADDYITKPFDQTELEARIKANLRWKTIIRAKELEEKCFIQHGNLKIDLNSYQVFVDDEPVSLYTKELKLLLLLINNKNRIFSAEQLYNQIWGENSVGDLKTVMVHVSNLRRKIEKDSTNPKFIITVRGFGYKFSLRNENQDS